MRRSIALLLVSATIGACAPAEGARIAAPGAVTDTGARRCFQPARIVNFTRGDTEQIYIRTLQRDVFSIQSGGCPDLGRSTGLLIAPATGIGDRLCVGDSVRISDPDARFGPDVCLGRVGSSLTEAEVEALPSRYRP